MFRLDSLISGALAGGVAWGLIALTFGSTAQPDPRPSAPAAPAPDPTAVAPHLAAAEDTLLSPRMARLEERLDQLEHRLARLDQRPAAMSPVSDATDSASGAREAEQQRTLVLEVLEEQREREQSEAREELRAREQARAEQRADRVVEALALSGAERDTLAAILVEESAEQLDLIERLRELDPDDREARADLRDELRGLRESVEQELETQLGIETAQRIAEWEADNRRRGLFGAAPRGGLLRGRD